MSNGHEPDPAGAATEQDQMLKDSSGDQRLVEPERRSTHKYSPEKGSKVCRVKEELNEVVFWKFRMWMILIFILLLIVAVVLISLVLCSLVYRDKDEGFDASAFNVSRLFNGSFRMESPAANQSRALRPRLQEQLEALYKSSPALGRYFSSAEVAPLREDPAVAEFRLKFLMPEAQQAQLRRFTLSREMIYNVLRQFLWEQPGLQVEPSSLRLS
ncbi:TPA-induced transmembrane protein homolog isoform X2 [Synchiropus splendidus]|uniref:TPA-induced transmembrane protein homolog isoform X2 n=1 Tax=Synchiropus splendidus TaxID=270530 RepID=UPI00237E6424|nr:TPA-induced transmembrane protein homolog isoform X2 [Synchiropus splendidus]